MANSQSSVALDSVHFRYFESEAGLTDINLRVGPGDRVLLLGRNGAGKSTLLSVIGGRRKVHRGSVSVLGRDAFDDTTLNADVTLIGPPWPPEAFFATTVDGVTTPCIHDTRRRYIASRIHLPLSAFIDKMSAGEKRRVQILFGLMQPSKVILLDECSTEIDVAERSTVLSFVEEECRTKQCCCIYATHIFDGLAEWATHIAIMENGRLIAFESTKDIEDLQTFAVRNLSKKAFDPYRAPSSPCCGTTADQSHIAVECKNLSFAHVFRDLSFQIARGSRTLLVGCNGSGKSTLLKMIAGKTFFSNAQSELTVFSKRCFHDLSLDKVVSFCGDWWVKLPPGEVHVCEMMSTPLSPRAEEIRDLLAVNLDWDLRCVSSGELKRIQLLLSLQHARDVIVLDEATADLDVDQRRALLQFLFRESAVRGATVLYATHIFEGLGGWPTNCVVLSRTTKAVELTFGAPIDYAVVIQTLIRLKALEVSE